MKQQMKMFYPYMDENPSMFVMKNVIKKSNPTNWKVSIFKMLASLDWL